MNTTALPGDNPASRSGNIASLRSRALSALGVALVSVVGLPAAAQTLPEDECAQLSDPEAEITCLRAVLAATRQAQQAAPPASNEAMPEATRARPVVSGAPQPAKEEMGSEQLAGAATVRREADEREVVASTVTDFRVDRNGRLIMQLENGQIWRQVENLAVPVPLDADERVGVEITRSGFGGYRMSFPELNRRISVSRAR